MIFIRTTLIRHYRLTIVQLTVVMLIRKTLNFTRKSCPREKDKTMYCLPAQRWHARYKVSDDKHSKANNHICPGNSHLWLYLFRHDYLTIVDQVHLATNNTCMPNETVRCQARVHPELASSIAFWQCKSINDASTVYKQIH